MFFGFTGLHHANYNAVKYVQSTASRRRTIVLRYFAIKSLLLYLSFLSLLLSLWLPLPLMLLVLLMMLFFLLHLHSFNVGSCCYSC